MSGGGGLLHFNIAGRPPKTPHDYVAAGYRTVTPKYLETLLGIPLLQGRVLAPGDIERAPAVVADQRHHGSHLFPGRKSSRKENSARCNSRSRSANPNMEIVGVVGDVVQGLGDDPKAEMYLPYRQADQVLPVLQLSMVLRTAGRSFAAGFRAAQRSFLRSIQTSHS